MYSSPTLVQKRHKMSSRVKPYFTNDCCSRQGRYPFLPHHCTHNKAYEQYMEQPTNSQPPNSQPPNHHNTTQPQDNTTQQPQDNSPCAPTPNYSPIQTQSMFS